MARLSPAVSFKTHRIRWSAAQREQVVLSGAALWSVLANFVVQIDPVELFGKNPA